MKKLKKFISFLLKLKTADAAILLNSYYVLIM